MLPISISKTIVYETHAVEKFYDFENDKELFINSIKNEVYLLLDKNYSHEDVNENVVITSLDDGVLVNVFLEVNKFYKYN